MEATVLYCASCASTTTEWEKKEGGSKQLLPKSLYIQGSTRKAV